MKYEEFKEEVERVPLETGEPTSWSEIRDPSDKLNKKVLARNGKHIEPEEQKG